MGIFTRKTRTGNHKYDEKRRYQFVCRFCGDTYVTNNFHTIDWLETQGDCPKNQPKK